MTFTMGLSIQELSVMVGERLVLNGVSVDVREGQIHALMGPNGSGKSSLAYAAAGHPEYRITGGNIFLKGEDVTLLTPEARATKGLFLSFQEPPEIGGVSMVVEPWKTGTPRKA